MSAITDMSKVATGIFVARDPLTEGQVHGPPIITTDVVDEATGATRTVIRHPAVRGVSGPVAHVSADRTRVLRTYNLGPHLLPATDTLLPLEEVFAPLEYGYGHGQPSADIRRDKVVISYPAELVVKMTSLRDPRWAGAEQKPGLTPIDCHCTFRHLGKEEVPFAARPDDPEPHGRDLYARLVAGEFGPVAPFVGG